jgi:hypothetical protein
MTGASGGGGANGQWQPMTKGLLPFPPTQSQAGTPATVTDPYIEIKSGEYLYLSIPLSYPTDWPPEDIDLRAVAREMLADQELWETYRDEIYTLSVDSIKSNYVPAEVIPELADWRAESDHWISSSEIISEATITFGEVGGYPRVWWEVKTTSFQSFRKLPPVLPPVPPPPGVPETPGSGHGTVIAEMLNLLFGGCGVWPRKRAL